MARYTESSCRICRRENLKMYLKGDRCYTDKRANERKVNIPSFQVKVGDVVAVKDKSHKVVRINEALEAVDRRGVPAWLELDKGAFKGTVKAQPSRDDITMPIQEQLIVELYSK